MIEMLIGSSPSWLSQPVLRGAAELGQRPLLAPLVAELGPDEAGQRTQGRWCRGDPLGGPVEQHPRPTEVVPVDQRPDGAQHRPHPLGRVRTRRRGGRRIDQGVTQVAAEDGEAAAESVELVGQRRSPGARGVHDPPDRGHVAVGHQQVGQRHPGGGDGPVDRLQDERRVAGRTDAVAGRARRPVPRRPRPDPPAPGAPPRTGDRRRRPAPGAPRSVRRGGRAPRQPAPRPACGRGRPGESAPPHPPVSVSARSAGDPASDRAWSRGQNRVHRQRSQQAEVTGMPTTAGPAAAARAAA